jgi:S-adenosylmethionine:tRNA ribosyltransferase-isomerase
MQQITQRGARIVFLTLHVGYGTFKPVRVADIRRHRVDEEYFELNAATAAAINETRRNGGRVIAVGTTVVRTLETVGSHGGAIEPQSGITELMITPGHSFKVVDALVTNFHLPRSSLLFLVCAFAGRDLIMRVYEHAVRNRYRFFSYGDAMFIV